MKAQLIESHDEHHWVLLDHRITQLSIDARAVRLQTWSLDGSAEIRLAAPFTLRAPGGVERRLDPALTESLAPMLALLRRGVRSLTIRREGELAVELGDGSTILAPPSRRAGAWELHGAGVLEGVMYGIDAEGAMSWPAPDG